MTWNYRLMNIDGAIGLHEVYYDDAGRPEMYTANQVSVGWDEDEGNRLLDELTFMAEAHDKSILTKEDFADDTRYRIGLTPMVCGVRYALLNSPKGAEPTGETFNRVLTYIRALNRRYL